MNSPCTQNTDRECRPEDCCLKTISLEDCFLNKENCDHLIGMHHHYDMLISESEKDMYFDLSDSIQQFNFCPACGEKLV